MFVYPHEKSRQVYVCHDQGVSMLDYVVADESQAVHIVMGGKERGTLLCVHLAVRSARRCVC